MMNPEAEKIRQRIENGSFCKNNGRILQMLNVLAGGFKKISEIKYVLSDIEDCDIARSIDYLFEGGYVRLRDIDTKRAVMLADTQLKYLEVKLTDKGVQILVGKKEDVCIEL